MTFGRLAARGLGPEPTAKNLGHEETTCRSKYPLFFSFFSFSLLFFYFFYNFIFLVAGIATMKENIEKAVTCGDEDATAPSVVQKPAI